MPDSDLVPTCERCARFVESEPDDDSGELCNDCYGEAAFDRQIRDREIDPVSFYPDRPFTMFDKDDPGRYRP